jgi:hypothetical protein
VFHNLDENKELMRMTDALTQDIIQIIKEEKPNNVRQLEVLLQQKLKLPKSQVLNIILKLQEQGEIELMRQPPPTSPNLASYLRTNQALWYWITIALATLTLAAVFFIPKSLVPWIYIRNTVGVVFVLWLPGFTLIKALFPIKVPFTIANDKLATVERIGLSLGMSLTLVPIVVLLLNSTPWGIDLSPIVFSLFTIVVIFATVAVIREHQAKIKLETQK